MDNFVDELDKRIQTEFQDLSDGYKDYCKIRGYRKDESDTDSGVEFADEIDLEVADEQDNLVDSDDDITVQKP